MCTVDSKGAQELARVLAERHGAVPEHTPVPPLETEDAAPIFHWLGIEPPPSGRAADERAGG